MIRTRPLLVLVLTLGGVVAGCSQFSIRSGADSQADFTRLHTWAWLPVADAAPADQRVLDPYFDERIRAAVARELAAKGYRPAETTPPDFLLNYRLQTSPGAGGFEGYVWNGWAGIEPFYADAYDDGTLFLAVLDPRTRRMIWVGAAEARLVPTRSIAWRTKRTDAAVHDILARFPPGR